MDPQTSGKFAHKASRDYFGTSLIILGVVGIVGFSSFNKEQSDELNLDILKGYWSKPLWISYAIILGILTAVLYVGSEQLEQIIHMRDDEEAPVPRALSASPSERWYQLARLRRLNSNMKTFVFRRLDQATLRWSEEKMSKNTGIFFAITGGTLASQTLVMAKSLVKLTSTQLDHNNTTNQFTHPLSILIILLTAVTAVLQIFCLNKGLALYSTTIIAPLFYGVYTTLGFINSLIYFNQLHAYKAWVSAVIAYLIRPKCLEGIGSNFNFDYRVIIRSCFAICQEGGNHRRDGCSRSSTSWRKTKRPCIT